MCANVPTVPTKMLMKNLHDLSHFFYASLEPIYVSQQHWTVDSKHYAIHVLQYRARIFKSLWCPGLDFKKINSASLCNQAGRYDNIPTRFLAPIGPIDCFKTLAQLPVFCSIPSIELSKRELCSIGCGNFMQSWCRNKNINTASCLHHFNIKCNLFSKSLILWNSVYEKYLESLERWGGGGSIPNINDDLERITRNTSSMASSRRACVSPIVPTRAPALFVFFISTGYQNW